MSLGRCWALDELAYKSGENMQEQIKNKSMENRTATYRLVKRQQLTLKQLSSWKKTLNL